MSFSHLLSALHRETSPEAGARGLLRRRLGRTSFGAAAECPRRRGAAIAHRQRRRGLRRGCEAAPRRFVRWSEGRAERPGPTHGSVSSSKLRSRLGSWSRTRHAPGLTELTAASASKGGVWKAMASPGPLDASTMGAPASASWRAKSVLPGSTVIRGKASASSRLAYHAAPPDVCSGRCLGRSQGLPPRKACPRAERGRGLDGPQDEAVHATTLLLHLVNRSRRWDEGLPEIQPQLQTRYGERPAQRQVACSSKAHCRRHRARAHDLRFRPA